MLTELSGLVIFALVLLARVVVAIPPLRRLVVRGWDAFRVRVSIDWDAPATLDPWAVTVALMARRDRLLRDLRRVTALLDTDVTMSATRQLGNRIAHGWLLRQVQELEALLLATGMGAGPTMGAAVTGPGFGSGDHRPATAAGRTVEVLDTGGWRSATRPS